jgi:hypothetical protein
MPRPLRAAKMVAPSTSTGWTMRDTGAPTRVCRWSWMLAGVSGVPETIHSAPEVKTWRWPPEKTPRMAFTWSDTSPNSIAWSSRPAPRSKLNRSPVRDIQSRFGRSREPPTTSRSWWKQRHTGPAARPGEGGLVPVERRRGGGERRVLHRGAGLRRRGYRGDDHPLAAEAEARGGVAAAEQRLGRRQRDGAGRAARREHRAREEAEEGLAHEGPGLDGPARVAGAGDALGRHLRVAEEQRVGALGVGELGQHRGGPGAGDARHLGVADEDAHLAGGEREQVGLLRVELEGDEARGAGERGDVAEAGAAHQAAGRLDEHVAQAPRAVRPGAEVRAAEQLGRHLAGGEGSS